MSGSGARHSGEPLAAEVRQVEQAGDEQARTEDQRGGARERENCDPGAARHSGQSAKLVGIRCAHLATAVTAAAVANQLTVRTAPAVTSTARTP